MKRSLVVSVLMLVLSMAARAQESSGVSVYVSSGWAIPSSPMTFADYWNMQYGGGVGVGYPLAPSITLVGSVEYYRFTLNNDGLSRGFDVNYMRSIWIFNDVSLAPTADPSSVTTASANLRVAPAGATRAVSPYLLAGMGVMHFSLSEITLPVTSVLGINGTSVPMTAQRRVTGGSETALFAQLGIGAEYRLSELVKPFIEARYGVGMTKGIKTNYIPLTAGLKIQL